MTTAPSPSPMSPTLPFPSPIPKKERPNPHPYAIKTTSSGLLSRSNSTTSSTSAHHYVPTSPSPTQANHSPTKHYKPSRHRYSRSLTSDLPQPLPRPPNADNNSTGNAGYAYGNTGSPSPSPTHMRKMGLGIRLGNASESEDDDQTPRRRGQRAETLPSSTGPPEVSPPANLDLPEDPKTWTPSQLSTYLSSTLRAGNADLPQPVAKDIAAFVRENRITGKAFMRLSEDDLIQYGINQLWRYTLLASSRSLRQSTLRGRIWGFGNTPDPQTQLDEDPGNLSSSSTSSDVRGTRSRHSSSASESAGRVRDMVESLERTKQLEEEERSRSTSPTKMHQRERRPSNASASPSKHSRPLPQRGNVSDLFAMPDNQIARTESDAAVEEKEGDATITGVAKRNVHGREPRMLPFPPTHTGGAYPYPQAIPALTPSHTGAAYPLPMSPQQTGYGASDYELGFRSPTHHQHHSPHGHPDPNTQVYVVRHNPSPSRQVEGEVKPASGRRSHGKRLLPYPPVVGQAELHHPRPRRLVGVAQVDTGYESADEESGAGGTTTGTEGYDTALESQASRSDSGRSTGTVQHGDEEEEKTVEELLRTGEDAVPAPISGVEAWEMELGETVKRIGGEGGNGAAKKGTSRDVGPGSVAEIGRKAGRAAGAGGTMATRGKEKENNTRRGGILGLFEPPPVEGEEETKVNQQENVDERAVALDAREEKLVEREVAVGQREDTVRKLEETVNIRRSELEQHESALLTKEHTLSERDVILTERATTLATEEKALKEKESNYEAKAVLLERREKDSTEQHAKLEEREALVGKREQAVQAKEAALKEKEVELKEKEVELKEKEVGLGRREEEVGRHEAEVGRERGRLEEQERMFKASRRIDLTPAPWPLPITLNLLKKVWGSWVEPIVGEERTPAFLSSKNAATVKEESELPSAPDQDVSSATSSPNPSRFLSPDTSSVHDSIGKAKPEATSSEDLNPTRPKPYLTSTWAIRRDAILGGLPRLSGGYLVLMSLGMCVIVLRVLTRRAGGLLGRR